MRSMDAHELLALTSGQGRAGVLLTRRNLTAHETNGTYEGLSQGISDVSFVGVPHVAVMKCPFWKHVAVAVLWKQVPRRHDEFRGQGMSVLGVAADRLLLTATCSLCRRGPRLHDSHTAKCDWYRTSCCGELANNSLHNEGCVCPWKRDLAASLAKRQPSSVFQAQLL